MDIFTAALAEGAPPSTRCAVAHFVVRLRAANPAAAQALVTLLSDNKWQHKQVHRLMAEAGYPCGYKTVWTHRVRNCSCLDTDREQQ